MKLYTCGQKGKGGNLPFPLTHACGKAINALDDAGLEYELEVAPGYKLMPWTRSGDARAEIRKLTGQDDVPVLLLDDGTAIAGSGKIVDWVESHPATS